MCVPAGCKISSSNLKPDSCLWCFFEREIESTPLFHSWQTDWSQLPKDGALPFPKRIWIIYLPTTTTKTLSLSPNEPFSYSDSHGRTSLFNPLSRHKLFPIHSFQPTLGHDFVIIGNFPSQRPVFYTHNNPLHMEKLDFFGNFKY